MPSHVDRKMGIKETWLKVYDLPLCVLLLVIFILLGGSFVYRYYQDVEFCIDHYEKIINETYPWLSNPSEFCSNQNYHPSMPDITYNLSEYFNSS